MPGRPGARHRDHGGASATRWDAHPADAPGAPPGPAAVGVSKAAAGEREARPVAAADAPRDAVDDEIGAEPIDAGSAGAGIQIAVEALRIFCTCGRASGFPRARHRWDKARVAGKETCPHQPERPTPRRARRPTSHQSIAGLVFHGPLPPVSPAFASLNPACDAVTRQDVGRTGRQRKRTARPGSGRHGRRAPAATPMPCVNALPASAP